MIPNRDILRLRSLNRIPCDQARPISAMRSWGALLDCGTRATHLARIATLAGKNLATVTPWLPLLALSRLPIRSYPFDQERLWCPREESNLRHTV